MLELIGIAAIAGTLAGSLLLALFLAQTVINLTLALMVAGVQRAEQRRAGAAVRAGKMATVPVLQRQGS